MLGAEPTTFTGLDTGCEVKRGVPTFGGGQNCTRSGEGNSAISFECLISSLGYKLGAQ